MKLVLASSLLMVSLLPAQTLTVNGQTSDALVSLGAPVSFEIQGGAGLPIFWAFSLPGGPLQLGTQVINLDLLTLTLLVQGLPMPPSGVFNLSFPLPSDPVLSGITLHSAALLLDSSHPDGFVVTNTISFTFIAPGADAGPDAAALAGESVTLDGSGNRDTTGAIPSGTSMLWLVHEAPAMSTPAIEHDAEEFPVFKPDVAGTYVVELQTMSPGGFSADRVRIDVYDIDFTSPADGSFHVAPLTISGSVAGPGTFTFEVGGTSMPVTSSATFSTVTSSAPVLTEAVTGRVTLPSGIVLEKTVTAFGGASLPLGTATVAGAHTRLQGSALDALEPPLELALGGVQLGPIITALPPVTLINTPPLFTATATFTQASYDPLVDVDLSPGANHIGISVTFTNLNIQAGINGVIFFLPYAETATMTATSAVVAGELVIAANPAGGIQSSMQNSSATLTNFQLSVTGVLAGISQLAALSAAIQAAIEGTLTSMLDQLPGTIDPLLSGLVPSVDLTASGIPLQVDMPLNSVLHDLGGVTFVTDFSAAATSLSPNAPQPAAYLSTPGSGVPTFGATTPVAGNPFDYAMGMNDDLFNQSLAELTRAGALSGDTAGVLLPGLDAGSMNLLFPLLGFELFAPSDPVLIRYRVTSPPVVGYTAGAATPASMHVGNLALDFCVDRGGVLTPVLLAASSLELDMAISLAPVTGAILVTPTLNSSTATLRGVLAGRVPGPALTSMNAVLQSILPVVTAPLTSLPLPVAGFGLGVVSEVSVTSPVPDTLDVYVDVP